jgi:hypothetical protein
MAKDIFGDDLKVGQEIIYIDINSESLMYSCRVNEIYENTMCLEWVNEEKFGIVYPFKETIYYC